MKQLPESDLAANLERFWGTASRMRLIGLGHVHTSLAHQCTPWNPCLLLASRKGILVWRRSGNMTDEKPATYKTS